MEHYVADDDDEEEEESKKKEDKSMLEASTIEGFINISDETAQPKAEDNPEKLVVNEATQSKSRANTQSNTDPDADWAAKMMEEYHTKKAQINDFTGKSKTREIRMPTELTNARGLQCKISE